MKPRRTYIFAVHLDGRSLDEFSAIDNTGLIMAQGRSRSSNTDGREPNEIVYVEVEMAEDEAKDYIEALEAEEEA